MLMLGKMRDRLLGRTADNQQAQLVAPAGSPAAVISQDYWSGYHIDAPDSGYPSSEASLEHFDWRNRQYPGYIELMPVNQANDLIVMDYGCGPGHDVIGFGCFSRPKRIIAVDISPVSLGLAARRAELHGLSVDFRQAQERPTRIPIEDSTVDLVHCSGVLHHTPDPAAILREFGRVLKRGGRGQIMVYHYDSIWMHLYVAHQMIVCEAAFAGMTKRQAFEKTTDGPNCPIALCYTAGEFVRLAESADLRCEFIGASMSMLELKLLPRRFEAIEDKRLDAESRRFLYDLTFNHYQWPLHKNVVAGVNACFKISRRA
jgi:ubiquinone/menaquinone biosynthesis C-methylase UbiE